jgi:hypothetical protein
MPANQIAHAEATNTTPSTGRPMWLNTLTTPTYC